MKLQPHSDFARLRLKDFLIGDMETEPLMNWGYVERIWIGEKVCDFTHFLRLTDDPETLRCIELDLSVGPQKVWNAILQRVGLPLYRGMTKAQVTKSPATKPTPLRPKTGRTTVAYRLGREQAYDVRCAIDRMKGLVHVMILRADAA